MQQQQQINPKRANASAPKHATTHRRRLDPHTARRSMRDLTNEENIRLRSTFERAQRLNAKAEGRPDTAALAQRSLLFRAIHALVLGMGPTPLRSKSRGSTRWTPKWDLSFERLRLQRAHRTPHGQASEQPPRCANSSRCHAPDRR